MIPYMHLVHILVLLVLSTASSFELELSELREYLDPAFDLRTCNPLDRLNKSRLEEDFDRFLVRDEEYSRCVNPSFLPRVLSTRQISWRSSHGAAGQDWQGGSKKGVGNGGNGHNSTDDTKTKWQSGGGNTSSKGDGEEEIEGKNDVVHKFLAFGLALPRHPFSTEFLTTLKAVAPLFPEVTVIVGNGEEFVEFSQQYNVRSYPKLLVFNWGVLHGRYTADFERGYSEQDLVSYFSKWTNSKPASKLLPKELSAWSGKDHELRVYDDPREYGDMVRVLPSKGDGIWSGKIALVKSPKVKTRALYQYFVETLEPVVDQEVDCVLYVVSFLFVIFRIYTQLRRSD